MKKAATKIGKLLFIIAVTVIGTLQLQSTMPSADNAARPSAGSSPAAEVLTQLAVKGRAPKTGYSRDMFSSGWGIIHGCDLRNYILARDMTSVSYVDDTCKVQTGILADPYTGTMVQFFRGTDTSDDVQIDHVVALSDAWQKGAQQLSPDDRFRFANDPLNLLAVDGNANQNKGDSDAASWLPPNKSYRCAYVARQIAVKAIYSLWVTAAEYNAMANVLTSCPEQVLA